MAARFLLAMYGLLSTAARGQFRHGMAGSGALLRMLPPTSASPGSCCLLARSGQLPPPRPSDAHHSYTTTSAMAAAPAPSQGFCPPHAASPPRSAPVPPTSYLAAIPHVACWSQSMVRQMA